MSATRNNDLEKRIKALEEELHVLKEKLNSLMSKRGSTLNSSEASRPATIPDSMDKDDWYTNHGHGD